MNNESIAGDATERAIAQHPFFRGLKPEHIKILAANAMRVPYDEGQLIFRAGEPANRFYLIEAGKVSIESHKRDEPDMRLQTIGPGCILGWSWLFSPHFWRFDARALETTTALFFYGTRLREQCEEDHDLGYELMKRMAEVVVGRLQSARKRLLSLPMVEGVKSTPAPLCKK